MRSFLALVLLLGLAVAPRVAAGPSLPDPAGVADTYFAARRWLDGGGGAVPTPPDVRSAAVVLRLNGRAIGFGKDAGEGPQAQIAERALRAALADARSKPRARPFTGDDEAGFGRLLTLELELAGAREPLVGRTFDELARGYDPGECGLQLVDGQRVAYEPASHLLARRIAWPPSAAVIAMLSDLALPARDLPELQELGGATALYASRGIRLVQLRPDADPIQPARVLPATEHAPASRPRAAGSCAAAVARLAAQLAPPVTAEGVPAEAAAQLARIGLRGDYMVTQDRYEPLAARPADQAWTAWALMRVASVGTFPGALRADASRAALAVLEALAAVDPSESAPAEDAVAVACSVLAADDAPQDAVVPATVREALGSGLARFTEPAALATSRPLARALLLDAAAAEQARGMHPMPSDRIEAELSRLLGDLPAADLPGVAPLVFDAFRRLDPARWSERLAPWREKLEAARTVLVATQVPAASAERPASLADLPGAFPLTGASTGRVGAQSARAQLFVAMLAGHPAGRDARRDDEDRRSLAWATRFLIQLQAGDPIAYCAPAADRAIGGFLASPAEPTQPLAAQAMALLALAETELAFGRLDAAARDDGGGTSVPAGPPGKIPGTAAGP